MLRKLLPFLLLCVAHLALVHEADAQRLTYINPEGGGTSAFAAYRDTWYAAHSGGPIHVSTGGVYWRPVEALGRDGADRLGADSLGRIFAVQRSRILRWSPGNSTSDDITGGYPLSRTSVFEILPDGAILAGGVGLFKFDGATWREVLTGTVSRLVIRDDGSILALASEGVLTSNDAGDSWRRYDAGIFSPKISAIASSGAVDLLVADRFLYTRHRSDTAWIPQWTQLRTSGDVLASRSNLSAIYYGGLLSFDTGRTWKSYGGLDGAGAMVALHVVSDQFIAVTSTRGIMVLPPKTNYWTSRMSGFAASTIASITQQQGRTIVSAVGALYELKGDSLVDLYHPIERDKFATPVHISEAGTLFAGGYRMLSGTDKWLPCSHGVHTSKDGIVFSMADSLAVSSDEGKRWFVRSAHPDIFDTGFTFSNSLRSDGAKLWLGAPKAYVSTNDGWTWQLRNESRRYSQLELLGGTVLLAGQGVEASSDGGDTWVRTLDENLQGASFAVVDDVAYFRSAKGLHRSRDGFSWEFFPLEAPESNTIGAVGSRLLLGTSGNGLVIVDAPTMSVADVAAHAAATAFPNPFDRGFKLNVVGRHRGVTIYNPLGQVVFDRRAMMASEAIQIEADAWSSGVYFYTIQMESGEILSGSIVKR